MSSIIPYVFRPISLPSAQYDASPASSTHHLPQAGADAVQFSARRKPAVASNPFPQPRTEGLRFGAIRLYDGPYNNIRLITDFNDGTSNAEAERLFQSILDLTTTALYDHGTVAGLERDREFFRQKQAPGILNFQTISDIPARNRDYAGLSLLRLGGGRPSKDIIVHVVDPGVGNTATRTILTTEKHGVYIGPNNGTLSLLIQQLEHKQEKYELLQIDFDKVAELQKVLFNEPDYQIPPTFHGRDVFVVAAGAIAAGLDPRGLTRPTPVEPVLSNTFNPTPFNPELREPVAINVIRDNTSGNLKSDQTLTQAQSDALQASGKQFTLLNPVNQKSITVTACTKFSDVAQGSPLQYLGSTHAPDEKSRFLEFAVNFDDASKALGLDGQNGAKQLVILPGAVSSSPE